MWLRDGGKRDVFECGSFRDDTLRHFTLGCNAYITRLTRTYMPYVKLIICRDQPLESISSVILQQRAMRLCFQVDPVTQQSPPSPYCETELKAYFNIS